MPAESRNPLLTFIRRLAVSPYHSGLSDGELLQRFAGERDKAAFTALMHRHGPMVLSVCRSLLRNEQDAEDVFQATFLVLVRKVQSIGKPASVASWLHGVAYRLAMKARAESARQRACQAKAVPMPASDPQDEAIWRDLWPILHEEIARLPERYRLPFVLCYLQGKTNQEAAALLGWPKGTVLSSLSRARSRLRARLTRRGVVLTGGVAAVFLSPSAAPAALPAALAESTLQAALAYSAGAGTMAVPAVAYAERLLHSVCLAKLKATAAVFLVVSALGTGTGAFLHTVCPTLYHHQPEESARAPHTNSSSLPKKAATTSTLQGNWIIATATLNGQETDTLTGRRFNFEGDRFILSAGGRGIAIIPGSQWEGGFVTTTSGRQTRIELKPNADFRMIRLIQDTGAKRLELKRVIRERATPLEGSYSVKDETLTLHLSTTNKDRGTELLLVLKRE